MKQQKPFAIQHDPAFSEKLVMPQKSIEDLVETGERQRFMAQCDKERNLEYGQMLREARKECEWLPLALTMEVSCGL